VFKYGLNGNLKSFEVFNHPLEQQQIDWLFNDCNFPVYERVIKEIWMKEFEKAFKISIEPADISFDALWELFAYKHGKQDAIKEYKKMKEDEIIKCFVAIPLYLRHIRMNGIAQIHLCRYISKRRYEDEITTTQPQPAKGANYNNPLKDLAKRKTEK